VTPVNRLSGSVGRIPELDGLRGVACLMVVVFHYCPRAVLPFPVLWSTGVDLFFVLSGLLLGGICLDNRGAANYFATFYMRRSCRIFPVYYAWIGFWLVLTAALPGFTNVFSPHFPAWPYLCYVQNFYMVARHSSGPLFLTPTWTLAIEEQFYIVLPALIWFCPNRRVLGGTVATLIGLACVTRIVAWATQPNWVDINYMWTFARWDGLFIGVLGAILVRRWDLLGPRQHKWLWVSAAVMCLLASPLTSARVLGLGGELWAQIKPTLVGALYLIAILIVLSNRLCGRLLSFGPLMRVGAISYGTYLVHQGVLFLTLDSFGRYPEGALQDWGIRILALAMTLAVAAISFRYFERPFIRFGHRWRYAERPVGIAARDELIPVGLGGAACRVVESGFGKR